MTEPIITYDFKEGLPIEFEIVSISNLYRQSKGILTSPHRTAFYHIIWFQKGSPIHLVDFKSIKVEPNTILFLNKDTVQIFDPTGEFEAKAVLFTNNFFGKTQADVKFLRSTILFNDLMGVSRISLEGATSVFATIFSLMEGELDGTPDALRSDILRNHLHNFLLLAERERRKGDFVEIKKGADLDYTLLFKELVEAQYKHNKQVSHYASQLSVTEKRLNGATSKILGKTPKALIDERVILEAKRLLAHSSENIKEVAYALGFQEPTNFIKYFRKHSGNTPVEFREKFVS